MYAIISLQDQEKGVGGDRGDHHELEESAPDNLPEVFLTLLILPPVKRRNERWLHSPGLREEAYKLLGDTVTPETL